jgi:hypothetical protein
MTTGNGVPAATDSGEDAPGRDGNKNLRDIEDLVARLQIVTKQLALPPRSMPAQRPALAGNALAGTALTGCALTSNADEFAHAQSLGPGNAGDAYGERNQ